MGSTIQRDPNKMAITEKIEETMLNQLKSMSMYIVDTILGEPRKIIVSISLIYINAMAYKRTQ
jgi:hypothetical protein